MIFYALRSKKTGFYMPAGVGRGRTYDEPAENCIPRLFKRKSDASNALRWWLSGKWYTFRAPSEWDDDETKIDYIPSPPSRKEQQMEIVVLEIREF